MQRLRLGFLLVSLILLLTACPDPIGEVTAPNNVQATPGTGSIIVSWDAVSGADGYKVYRFDVAATSETVVANCNPKDSSPCEDTDVEQGKNYRYSVSTLKGSVESKKSGRTDPESPNPVDNSVPDISLTASPSTINEGESSTLTATVSAKNGKTISKVEFLNDSGTVIATDTTAPYTQSVSPTSTKTYTAKVTDSGNKTAQDTATVTVNPGSTSCAAEAKSYTGVVNTPVKGGTRTAGEIAVIVSPLLGTSCSTTVSSVSGATHGTVEKVGDKGFKFVPDLKYIGNATFTYNVSDGSSATVTLDIQEANPDVAGTQYVWYVDNTNPGGTGSATNPFVSYTQGSGGTLTMRSDFGVGDTIYLASGGSVYQGTVTMKANQRMIGEGVNLTVNDLFLAEAGTNPRMTSSKLGFDLGAGSETGVYEKIGILEIKGITIQNITGGPTPVSDGTGIQSDNLEGHLIIEDVTISGVTGHGLYLDHNNHEKPQQHKITIRNVTITNPGQYGIWIDDPTDLLIEDSQITGIKGGVTYGSNGIDVQDEFGNHGEDRPVVIRNVTISGGADTAGIRFIKNNKCRTNVNDNEGLCNTVTKEDSTMVVQNNTITTPIGILMQTQTGEEDKTEIYPGTTSQSNHFEYFGNQGDVILKYSGSSISCQKVVYEFPGSTPAQVTEARNKIITQGITCN